MANFISTLIRTTLDRLTGSSQKTSSANGPAATGKTPKPSSRTGSRGAAETATGKTPSSRPDSQPRRSRRRRRRPKRKPEAAQAEQTATEQQEPANSWDISQFVVAPEEGKTRFHDLNLPEPIMHAIADLGFQYCTPVQAEILAGTLAGKDATGRAQTGTGKTAAFIIVILNALLRRKSEKRAPGTPRALIIAPTRELVMQIGKDARALARYCPVKIMTVYGGMDYQKQKVSMSQGRVDILVATPGRLLDFHRQKLINLKKAEILVIDEADRMLDMGFIPDVRRIIRQTPPKEARQTLLFSATLPPDVLRLAEQWTTEPITVDIEPEQVAVDTVEQLVYTVTVDKKFALLYNLITRQKLDRVLIFCNRRDEVRRLVARLERYGINCASLSGEVHQKKRIRTLEEFRAGKIAVLVATDVMGRGIHIEGMERVINYTLPLDPEDYVHRIGRTGRAGEEGTSISFACEEDGYQIPVIEKFIGMELPCTTPEEDWLSLPPPLYPAKPTQKRQSGGKRGSGNRRRPGRGRSRGRKGQ